MNTTRMTKGDGANLAWLLRSETKTLHTEAERAGIMPELLRGNIDRKRYCTLLRNFHAIYHALENALVQHASCPLLQAIHFPELARTNALTADLDFLYGPDWDTGLPLTPSGASYVEHLSEISAHDSRMLIAHSYVRYLGDLSGGQILRQIVAGALALHGGEGTNFYRFGGAGATALASRYRQALGEMDVDGDTATRIVTEAQSAFHRHIALFEELAGDSGDSQLEASGTARVVSKLPVE